MLEHVIPTCSNKFETPTPGAASGSAPWVREGMNKCANREHTFSRNLDHFCKSQDSVGDPRFYVSRIRDKAEDTTALQTAEIAQCSTAASGESGKTMVDNLRTLHRDSVTMVSAVQEALDTLHEDVMKSSGKAGQASRSN